LYSAEAVMLPPAVRAPPIQATPAMRGAMSGASRKASATLVSGPVTASVTVPAGRARNCSTMKFAACPGATPRRGV